MDQITGILQQLLSLPMDLINQLFGSLGNIGL
jgi:hypothetical protein